MKNYGFSQKLPSGTKGPPSDAIHHLAVPSLLQGNNHRPIALLWLTMCSASWVILLELIWADVCTNGIKLDQVYYCGLDALI